MQGKAASGFQQRTPPSVADMKKQPDAFTPFT